MLIVNPVSILNKQEYFVFNEILLSDQEKAKCVIFITYI